MKKRFALIIGNSNYEDPRFETLAAPLSDIKDLCDILGSPHFGNFDEVRLLDNGSSGEIRNAIADFFSEREPSDLLLLYFSGHGALDIQGQLFLAARDSKSNRLNASGISADFVKYEMDNSRSRRQILVLDCCYSGAFRRGTKTQSDVNLINSVTFQASGRVVLTATNPTQFAWEGNIVVSNTKNSLFTHFLLEGIKSGKADINQDGVITIDEWYEYAYYKVTEVTSYQTPQKFIYFQEGDALAIAYNWKQEDIISKQFRGYLKNRGVLTSPNVIKIDNPHQPKFDFLGIINHSHYWGGGIGFPPKIISLMTLLGIFVDETLEIESAKEKADQFIQMYRIVGSMRVLPLVESYAEKVETSIFCLMYKKRTLQNNVSILKEYFRLMSRVHSKFPTVFIFDFGRRKIYRVYGSYLPGDFDVFGDMLNDFFK